MADDPGTQRIRTRWGEIDSNGYTLAEELTITNELAAMNEDGFRFVFRNRFIKANGKVACKISSLVAFFDLASRKIVAPPDNLLKAILSLPRADDYAPLT
jgi:acyl-CoA thioester hydrolase